MKIPTITFTFDDGTLDHYINAAPILEKYGYRGIFAIVSGYLEGRCSWKYPVMTADMLKDLLVRGHEIASHTESHANMRALWFNAGESACYEEILGSFESLSRLLGEPIRYFCYPYNCGCPMVSRLARAVGMEPFDPIRRPNLGSYRWPVDRNSQKFELERRIFSGKMIVDLMFHGVLPGAGWNSFNNRDDFEFIVSTIKKFEQDGRVVVKKYSEAHPPRERTKINRLCEAVQCMCWPLIYRVYNGVRLKK